MAEEHDEELDDESFDDVEDDFDPGMDDEIGDDDIDLGEIDDDAGGFSSRKGGGGNAASDDLLESTYEEAVRANPKRQSAHRRRARVIEGILDTAELNTAEGAEKAWQSLESQLDTSNVKPYDIKAEYTENDVLKHPKFGIGYVVEIVSDKKIAVLFEDGIKRLAYNR